MSRMNSKIYMAFLVFALFQMGCSTPPVEDPQDFGYSESVWQAYRACMDNLRGAPASVCDNVGTGGAYSYNQYGSGGERLRGVVGGPVALKNMLDQAYREYLASLDRVEQERLISLWNEVSSNTNSNIDSEE